MNRNTSSAKKTAIVASCAFVVLAAYVLSILWRVSLAEEEMFGHSMLIPLDLRHHKFVDPPSLATWLNRTFVYDRGGSKVVVWGDKINGFQHIYGSALASYELGKTASHLLFCANEFAEATCDWNGITQQDLADRRKDLSHNHLGRTIGAIVRAQGLKGNAAEREIIRRVLKAMDESREYYPSYLDPRIAQLRETDLGCPMLPKHNPFNWILRAAGVPGV